MSDDDEIYLDDDGEPFDPEEAQRQIQGFIDNADSKWEPPTSELTDQALAIMRDTWERISAITSGHPNDKILAMFLHASSIAREIDPRQREYWIASATSTILSSQIPAAARPHDARTSRTAPGTVEIDSLSIWFTGSTLPTMSSAARL